jgi:hypothetical protein
MLAKDSNNYISFSYCAIYDHFAQVLTQMVASAKTDSVTKLTSSFTSQRSTLGPFGGEFRIFQSRLTLILITKLDLETYTECPLHILTWYI